MQARCGLRSYRFGGVNLRKQGAKRYADLDELKRSRLHEDAATIRRETVAGTAMDRATTYIDEQWQRPWNTHHSTAIRAEMLGARRNLINQFILVIDCFPLFLIRWRLAKGAAGLGRDDDDNSVDKG